MQPSLTNIKWIRQQALNQTAIDDAAGLIGMPRGTVRATVYDVDDPKNRGRVRVIFDSMNHKDIPQIEGAGKFSGSREGIGGNISHWIDTCPAFMGKQPPGLVGKRVNVAVSEGQYHYAMLQDVLYDPQNLVSEAAEKLEMPNNSSMVRLPVYPAGQLPPPDKVNLGCTVIEEGGPMNSDWVCVCLKRDGKHIWVRHGDLAHGHAGGNDITSQVDSAGNRPGPGQIPSIWDHVFVTSGGEMAKWSSFGTDPRGNPYGPFASWAEPPMGVTGEGDTVKPLKFKPAQLFNQTDALNFVRLPGFISGNIAGSFTSTFSPQIQAAVESVPGYNFAQKLVNQGQKVLAIAETARQFIDNPTETVINQGLNLASNYVTQASQQALQGIATPLGTISNVYSSISNAIG